MGRENGLRQAGKGQASGAEDRQRAALQAPLHLQILRPLGQRGGHIPHPQGHRELRIRTRPHRAAGREIKKHRNQTVPVLLHCELWRLALAELRSAAGFLSIFELVCRACYLLENCGARRAALRPYFNRLSDDFP